MPQIIEIEVTFQSHIGSVIRLGPGLNVITGPSGTGKTAVIRAVKWVAFNEPTGDAFVNKKVGYAEVVIRLDNGVEVKKQRKSGKTRYWVTGFEEPFEKAEVPQEVTKALGIEKQTFGDFTAALNFAFQLDAPFILSETASAGAKILGKIAGTEVVDMAIKDVGKDTHQARLDRSAAEKEIAKINGDLLQYADVDDLKQLVEASNYLISVVDEKLARKNRLESVHGEYIKTVENIFRADGILDELEYVMAVQALLAQIDGTQQNLERLQLLQSDLDYYRTRVECWTFEIKKLQGTEEAAAIVEGLEHAGARLASLKSLSTVCTVYTQQKAAAEKILEDLRDVDGLPAAITAVEADSQRAARLRSIASEWDYSQKIIDAANGRLEALKTAADIPDKIAQAENMQNRIERLRALRTDYRFAENGIKTAVNRLDEAESDVAKAEYELKQAWDAAGGICPLCDQPHERTSNHA